MRESNIKKRIVCFFPASKIYYGMGGAERRIPYVFSQLNNDDYDITIIFQVYDGQSKNILRDIERYVTNTTKIVFIKGHIGVLKYLIKQRFDWVCYTDCIIRSSIAIIGAALSGSHRIMMNITTSYSSLIFKNKFEKILFKFNVMLSNRLECLYPSSLNILMKEFPKKIISLTPCTLTNMQECTPNIKKTNNIVFAGRLVSGKGIELFIDAIAMIQDNIRESGYLCIICGDGPFKSLLERKVKNYNIEDIVDIRGHIEVRSILSESKIFCSLQKINNYPSQSLLEAIACGCYCIATKVGDTGSIINSAFGEMIEAEDKKLADALLKVIRFDEDKWKDIAVNASKFAATKFNLNNVVNHFEEVFENKITSIS